MKNNKRSSDESEQKTVNNLYNDVISTFSNVGVAQQDLDAKVEAMPYHFFPGFPSLVLNYLGGDVAPTLPANKKSENLVDVGHKFRLFDKRFEELMHPEAVLLANLILRRGKQDVEEAEALVRNNHDLLSYTVMVKDARGRWIRATPLQIAIMAGDTNLKILIEDENDRGLAERLIEAGELPKDEVTEQMKCINSKEAQQENDERNQRILSALIRFGEGLIAESHVCKNARLEVFKTHCQPLIAKYNETLESETNNIIEAGYIFDITILQLAAEWFKKNITRFSDWYSVQSDVFWINGFGKLQDQVSLRDRDIIRAGIADLVDDKLIPARDTQVRDDSPSHIFNSSSSLGVDFCLGCYGTRLRWAIAVVSESMGDIMYGRLADIRKTAIENICHDQEINYRKAI